VNLFQVPGRSYASDASLGFVLIVIIFTPVGRSVAELSPESLCHSLLL